jgi:hypothetical protein
LSIPRIMLPPLPSMAVYYIFQQMVRRNRNVHPGYVPIY